VAAIGTKPFSYQWYFGGASVINIDGATNDTLTLTNVQPEDQGVYWVTISNSIDGVMSYAVRSRTHEIGIRMALGAKPQAILTMVLRQGLILTGVGLAIGLGIALVLGRLAASILYGTSGSDPLTFVLVSLVMVATAAIAILIPALRAAHVQPTKALRYE